MKNIQKKVQDFCQQNGLESPVEHRVLDTLSELGEVAKEVLKMTNYGRQPLAYREELKEELGDVLYSLITVANTFGIDLEEAVETVLQKYEKRLRKGSAGSENE
jgi:NTP pyrophosphatase (non-canonical NTP hydrolase)